jgi:ABC-type transport system substrate-binding protein
MSFKKFFLALRKFFTFSGIDFFLKSLKKLELFLFFVFLFFFFFSASFLIFNLYHQNTKVEPKEGGFLREGEIGFPGYLNPIYSIASDVDDSITSLIFSGLIKFEDGKIVGDLVKEYQILEEGKVFQFKLKENIFWSDGEKITSDDVIFTVKSIQNPEIKSPLRPNWLGVEVEKISEDSFKFILKNPSAVFLENCTLRPIPKHLWENVPPENFSLSFLNFQPLSSGPYKLEKLERDKEGKIISILLTRNELYFGKKPFISKIQFKFVENEEKLIELAKLKEIDAFSLKEFREIPGFKVLNFKMPRYFGVFFNLKKKVFSEKEVREALTFGTNKEEILERAIGNRGKIVNSPILPEIFSFEKPKEKIIFDLERAKEILEKAQYQDLDGDGIREKIIKKEPSFQFKSNLSLGSRGKEVEQLQACLAKDPEIYPEKEITGYFGIKTKLAVIKFQEKYREEILDPLGMQKGTGEVKEKTREKLNEICFERKEEKIPLIFSLTTGEDPILLKTSEILKEQWERLGFKVEIKKYKIEDLKREIIPAKDYDALLFGAMLGKIPDPFPFWHSSQIEEVGVNLSNYKNKEVDKILEESRGEIDPKKRKEKLEKFQEILIRDYPAIFLYNPNYFYFVSDKIKGGKEKIVSFPSERFGEISDWYLKEKRVIKW